MLQKSSQAQSRSTVEIVHIAPLNVQMIEVPLVGIAPLICHRWTEKAKKEMLDKQMGLAKKVRQLKDPRADYEGSLYPYSDSEYGFPSIAFKSAAVDACTQVAGVTKVLIRGAFHIPGEFVPIAGTPNIREDMVRLGGINNPADIRYRGEFKEWLTSFVVEYNADVITPTTIYNLFNVAGFAIGVGEWRPERNGAMGRFRVANTKDEEAFRS